MRKIVLLAALLCSICFSQGGWWKLWLPAYDYNIYKETGKSIFNGDMKDVVFNDEVIAKIETKKGYLFASSFKNGQITLSVDNRHNDGERYTMMYTIDVKSKTIVKEERLKTIHTYKDTDLEFSIDTLIDWEADTNAVMQYTWKEKRHKVTLPSEYGPLIRVIYDGLGNAYLVFDIEGQNLYVFSMDKKKLTWLGHFMISCCISTKGFYFPLNEYVIYYPRQSSSHNVFLYRYAEDAFYTTRYQKIDKKTVDTIQSNLKNGNTYEQFLPLTKVENKDSLVRYFLCSKHTIYHDCRLDGGAF